MIVIPNRKDNFKKFKKQISLLRDKFDINVEDFSIYSYSAKIFYKDDDLEAICNILNNSNIAYEKTYS